jgi:hypothetical protein
VIFISSRQDPTYIYISISVRENVTLEFLVLCLLMVPPETRRFRSYDETEMVKLVSEI